MKEAHWLSFLLVLVAALGCKKLDKQYRMKHLCKFIFFDQESLVKIENKLLRAEFNIISSN